MDFSDFGSILDGPGPSKNWLKIEKIDCFFDFLARSVLKESSGKVLGQFWKDFGRIFNGFWSTLGRFWDDF